MSGLYIIPLDLGDSLMEKSTSYLRMFIGEKEPRKRIAAYIGGAKKKILIDTGPADLERVLNIIPTPGQSRVSLNKK